MEEFQLKNKTLENTLQKNTTEFNQELTTIQQKLQDVEQNNQVTKNSSHVFLFEINHLLLKGFINDN